MILFAKKQREWVDMGSFNSVCAISDVVIEEKDEVIIVPLLFNAPNQWTNPYRWTFSSNKKTGEVIDYKASRAQSLLNPDTPMYKPMIFFSGVYEDSFEFSFKFSKEEEKIALTWIENILSLARSPLKNEYYAYRDYCYSAKEHLAALSSEMALKELISGIDNSCVVLGMREEGVLSNIGSPNACHSLAYSLVRADIYNYILNTPEYQQIKYQLLQEIREQMGELKQKYESAKSDKDKDLLVMLESSYGFGYSCFRGHLGSDKVMMSPVYKSYSFLKKMLEHDSEFKFWSEQIAAQSAFFIYADSYLMKTWTPSCKTHGQSLNTHLIALRSRSQEIELEKYEKKLKENGLTGNVVVNDIECSVNFNGQERKISLDGPVRLDEFDTLGQRINLDLQTNKGIIEKDSSGQVGSIENRAKKRKI